MKNALSVTYFSSLWFGVEPRVGQKHSWPSDCSATCWTGP
jgi:hypothetical protein